VADKSQIPEGAVRAAAHGDINLITLLMGGSAKGLQAQSLDGEWISVDPAPDEIVINIGDMLARLTNDRLRSTQHQVITPDEASWTKPRYSTPFFLHPRSDMDLTCLDDCVSENNPKEYADMTAGEFLTERLIELGLRKT
jgi:isopenicillin N synthase-like dioxygenase